MGWWLLPLLAVAIAACSGGESNGAGGDPASSGSFVIVDVMVFDGDQVIGPRSVVVSEGTIVEVGSLVDAPAGAVTVDGQGKTLLPGLIDAHVHLRGVDMLRQSARFGVTTMLDMLSAPSAVDALRTAAADRGDAADFRSAGFAATSPGGHGTQYVAGVPTLTSPDEAESFVASRIAEGADYLKIILEPRFPSTLDVETVAALIEAAHDAGLLAVVHVSTARDAAFAVDAGADGLAHVYPDEAPPGLPPRVAASGAFVTPTLTVHRSASGGAPGGALARDKRVTDRLTPLGLSQLLTSFPTADQDCCASSAAATLALRDAGVDILAGSDAPNPGTTFGASLHQELRLLVEAGLSAREALAAATSVPARRFALDDRGRIAPGLRADLLLVEGNPTADINATLDITAVWVRGKRVPSMDPIVQPQP